MHDQSLFSAVYLHTSIPGSYFVLLTAENTMQCDNFATKFLYLIAKSTCDDDDDDDDDALHDL